MRLKRIQLAGRPLAPLLWASLKAKQICLRPSGGTEHGCSNLLPPPPTHPPFRQYFHSSQVYCGSIKVMNSKMKPNRDDVAEVDKEPLNHVRVEKI